MIDETAVSVYIDRRYDIVLPLLDGRKTSDEIADQLRGEMPPAEVYFTLMHLEERGYIVDNEDRSEKTAVEECSLLSRNPVGFGSNVKKVFVLVDNLTSHADVGERFVAALDEAGIQAATESPRFAETYNLLRVALADDYLAAPLEQYHTERKSDGTSWLLVKPVGVTAWVGPLFSACSAVCWQCLANRLRTNRVVETYLMSRFRRSVRPPTRLLSPVVDVAKSLVASLLINEYAQQQTSNGSSFIEYDFRRNALERHHVARFETCNTCFPAGALAAKQEIVLKSRPKLYTSDGGYRSVHPTETLELERRLVSAHTGVVSRLFAIEDSNELLPVYLARHNYGYVPSSLTSEATNLANTSAGKGRTKAQARASALCEAVERHSVFLQGSETTVASSLRAMGKAAIHPNDCMLYSKHQYENRREWNRSHAWMLRIPEPLDPDEVIEWSPVWSMTENTKKYLPTTYLYHTPHTITPPRGGRFCFSDSNGNASGNNLEEAILQGFLELVERDAVAIWWYNQVVRPVVNLDQLDDPYIDHLLQAYRGLGREIWVLDITHDFRVPVYVALSRILDGARDEILTGFGAHLDPRIAISRALTELNQMLPRARRSSDRRRRIDEETETWFREVTLKSVPFLTGNAETSSPICNAVGPATGDLIDDINYCQEFVESLGMELLVLNQSRAETGLSSVKVIVPGMRHYWRRLSHGRLYEVPVGLGWLKSAKPEDRLNPFSMLG
jgi:ribosomal protein S12 methylthiotransferase accessory factor